MPDKTAAGEARFVTGNIMRHVVVMAGTGAIGLSAVFAVDLLNLFYISLLGQRPIAAVLPDSAEDELFGSHGWVLESHDGATVFQLASVASVARAVGPPPDSAELAVEGDLATATIGDRASPDELAAATAGPRPEPLSRCRRFRSARNSAATW